MTQFIPASSAETQPHPPLPENNLIPPSRMTQPQLPLLQDITSSSTAAEYDPFLSSSRTQPLPPLSQAKYPCLRTPATHDTTPTAPATYASHKSSLPSGHAIDRFSYHDSIVKITSYCFVRVRAGEPLWLCSEKMVDSPSWWHMWAWQSSYLLHHHLSKLHLNYLIVGGDTSFPMRLQTFRVSCEMRQRDLAVMYTPLLL